MHSKTEKKLPPPFSLITGLLIFCTVGSLLLFAYDGVVKWAILSYLLFLILAWIAGKAGQFRILTLLVCGTYMAGYLIDLQVLKQKTGDQTQILISDYLCAPRAIDLFVRNDGWDVRNETATKEIHSVVAARKLIYRDGRLTAGHGLDFVRTLHDFPKCHPGEEETKQQNIRTARAPLSVMRDAPTDARTHR